MIEYEYLHFATSRESTYKTDEHQQLLILKKRENQDCVPPNERTQHETTVILPKRSNLRLMKTLNPAANLQETQKTEEYAELHQMHKISKT